MASSILSAIFGITNYNNNSIADYASIYENRINSVGGGLEIYIKDALSDSLGKSQSVCEANHHKVFAWKGSQNNPPDIILKNGDAFEVKKIAGEGKSGSLQLNSSPPKNMLHSTDKRVLKECRECDGGAWKNKDLFYIVGNVRDKKIRYLFFVHGLCYAANESFYSKIHDPLKAEITGLIKSKGLETRNTVELGNVTKVDPLGITELRVRGMWAIKNPVTVFSKFSPISFDKDFSMAAIMTEQKYASFGKETKAIESDKRIHVKSIKVDDPNNPANEISAKLIQVWW